MRREGVAGRVRAHLPVEADGDRVALDDLVEPLPGEWPTAEVHEELGLEPGADKLRPAGAQVPLDRAGRLSPHRHRALLRSLPTRAQEASPQIDVPHFEADRL